MPIAKRRAIDSKDRSVSVVREKRRGRVELCEISGFRSDAVEGFVLLECYTVSVGSWLPVFKGQAVQGSSFTLEGGTDKP